MQITWNAWRFATSPQKLTEALGKTSILRYHNLRFMRKILGIRRLGSSDNVKNRRSLARNARFEPPTCPFCCDVAIPMLRVSEDCDVVLPGRRGTS